MHNQICQQQVFRLEHQVIRDLAWSLWGPALLIHSSPYNEVPYDETSCNDAFPLDLPWLKQLDQSPEVLIEYLEQKNTRLLGTYFEALWQFYFTHNARFKQCICNLQVNDESRTVGEFDALVTLSNNQDQPQEQDPQQYQSFHIELTCKFYLEWQDSLGETLWIGPNCGDRLDIKYDKTTSHQLPLLKTELGQTICKEHSFNSSAAQQIAMWRGSAFDRAHWFRVNELESEAALKEWRGDEQILWMIADKHHWLAPILETEAAALKTFRQIHQQINEHFYTADIQATDIQATDIQAIKADRKKFTLMLVVLAFNETNQQWQQQQKFFITPNNWPYGKLADSASTPRRPCKPPL